MIDVTDDNYEGPREWSPIVQDMEDYILNGPQKPQGEGWKLFNQKDCGSLMAYLFVRARVVQ